MAQVTVLNLNLNLDPLCSMKRRSIRRGTAWMFSVWRSWRSSPSSPAFLPCLRLCPAQPSKRAFSASVRFLNFSSSPRCWPTCCCSATCTPWLRRKGAARASGKRCTGIGPRTSQPSRRQAEAHKWNWAGNIWPFLAVGLAMQIGCLFLARFLPFPKETPFDELLQRHTTIVLVSVFAVTLGPLMEELFFRGFLYLVLARRFGMGTGISVTALGFGLMHAAQYGYSWASVLLIFLVGMVLGVVRARTDSVAAGFLVHMAYNGTIAVAMFAATGGFRHLERLNQKPAA